MNQSTIYLTSLTLSSLLLLTACGGGGSSSNDDTSVTSPGEPVSSAESPTVPEPPITEPPTTTEPTVADEPPELTLSPKPDEPENNVEPVCNQAQAQNSNDLCVEASFRFEMAEAVNFYISVNGNTGAPLLDTLVKLYAVPEGTENWDNLLTSDQQLLFIGQTDSNGIVDQIVELPPNTNKVLAVVSTIGISNKALLDINSGMVSHYF